ncbi:hypothetical protein CXF70_13330 [Planomicrobium sp. MB-3u-38]|nr:hypothetical protein CXF70_13330 [Planomicrobium sp. MB-3u-38]
MKIDDKRNKIDDKPSKINDKHQKIDDKTLYTKRQAHLLRLPFLFVYFCLFKLIVIFQGGKDYYCRFV